MRNGPRHDEWVASHLLPMSPPASCFMMSARSSTGATRKSVKAKRKRPGAQARVGATSSVCGSTRFTTWSTLSLVMSHSRSRWALARFRWRFRLIDQTTSSAVTGLPEGNLSPRRTLNVKRLPSGETVQLSATPGISFAGSAASMPTSASQTLRMNPAVKLSLIAAGSSVIICERFAATTKVSRGVLAKTGNAATRIAEARSVRIIAPILQRQGACGLEPEQRKIDALTDRKDLEQLAHLGRADEAVHRARRLEAGERHGRILGGDHHREPARDQEIGLRGETVYLGPALLRGARHGTEVDVRGDVLQARHEERVAVEMVAIVAAHGAHRALRMVELALGEAVVDEERHACVEALGEGAHEALGG